MKFLPAKKVGTAFHHRDSKLRRKMFLQKWNIFPEKLLLQRFCRRRNHNPPPAQDGRQQIGESLPRARPSLDDRVPMFRERRLDKLRHLELRPPMFVAASQRAFEQTTRAEDLRHRRGFGLWLVH